VSQRHPEGLFSTEYHAIFSQDIVEGVRSEFQLQLVTAPCTQTCQLGALTSVLSHKQTFIIFQRNLSIVHVWSDIVFSVGIVFMSFCVNVQCCITFSHFLSNSEFVIMCLLCYPDWLTDTDELRQTLSLVHWILDAKQKALQELYSEREVHSTCLYQVCSHYILADRAA